MFSRMAVALNDILGYNIINTVTHLEEVKSFKQSKLRAAKILQKRSITVPIMARQIFHRLACSAERYPLVGHTLSLKSLLHETNPTSFKCMPMKNVPSIQRFQPHIKRGCENKAISSLQFHVPQCQPGGWGGIGS